MPKDENKVEAEKPKMEVPVEVMQEILDNQKSMQTTIEELQKNNQALEKVVSQTRLQEAKATQDADRRARVHFKRLVFKSGEDTLQGVVVGWPDSKNIDDRQDIVNQLIINPQTNVAMGEMIKFRYFLADGSKTPLVDFVEFVRCTDLVYARVVEDKGDSALMEFEDKSVVSKPIEIKKVFWNA